jgi:hypothetical protein
LLHETAHVVKRQVMPSNIQHINLKTGWLSEAAITAGVKAVAADAAAMANERACDEWAAEQLRAWATRYDRVIEAAIQRAIQSLQQ